MRRFVVTILLVFWPLLLIPAAFAQTTSQGKAHPVQHKSTSTSAPLPKYAVTGLNIQETNVGQDFQGNDIVAVFDAIKDSPSLAKKGEFETTSAFEARRAAFTDHTLYGGVTPKDNLAFVLRGDSITSGAKLQYDADAQELVIYADWREQTIFGDRDSRADPNLANLFGA